MNLYSNFKPTFLCIKQHIITGKLYFCKTTKTESEMLFYRGSGKMWKRHFKKHGKEHVVTLWYQLYQEHQYFELNTDALWLSKVWNIVKSDPWLNLILENGIGGGFFGLHSIRIGYNHSIETKNKIGNANRGRKLPPLTEEQRLKRVGRICSDETRIKLSIAAIGRERSIEHRNNISKAQKRSLKLNVRIVT